MSKTKLKKMSKRMPARKKFKIEKKVKEHNRKQRKEAKAKAASKKLKKDPGIPNLFPFKEQLLQKMKSQKERVDGEKERQRQQRQHKHVKKRSLQGLQTDALKRTKEFEKRDKLEADIKESASRCGVDSDQSLRAYYREFRKVVDASDVVLEVLDARDPLGCRCVAAEEAILSAGSNKKLVLILNKIDLVPREIAEKWLTYLRKEFPTVAFKSSTQTQKHHLSQKKFALKTGPSSLLGTSSCLGAEVLLKLLGNYCRNADIKTSISVGVVGLPNVGKSSLINSLKRSKSCGVGATPGLTKCVQEVQLDKHVKLLDSPGIIMAGKSCDSSSSFILRNCVKVESLADPVSPVEGILKRCNRSKILEHFCIPEFDGVQEFLSHVAHRTGRLKKGGVPNVKAAACSVLRDWNTGKISFYTCPPLEHLLSNHMSAEIVKGWGKAFDIEALVEAEKQELKSLTGVKGEMMEMEPSQPLLESYMGGDCSHDNEEEADEDGMIEEEMLSEDDEEVEDEVECRGDEDGDIVLDDCYDFDEHFTSV